MTWLIVLLLCTSCSSPASPGKSQASVDVLSYLVGDPALWPRSGSHGQQQIVDVSRREVCWVKYGNPRWTLDVPQNQLVWFDAACRVDPSRSHAFPYRQRAWFEPRRDAGADLGARDTLVLEYQPYDPIGAAGAAEHYYLGLGAGWYEWERSGFRDLFNRTGGFTVAMDRAVWCDKP